MRLRGLQGVARVLTVASAAGATAVALVAAVALGQFALAAGVLTALLLRLTARSDQWRDVGAVGLVLAVAGVVGAGGGPRGPLLIALLFLVADYGLVHRTRRAVVVGVAAAVAAAVMAVAVDGPAVVDLDWVWVFVLVPLVGVTAGQVVDRQSVEGTAALESATAAMDEVLALAERIPAGFDRWSVATAVHLELLEASRLEQRAGATPHLLLVQEGVLFGVGAPVARQPVGLLADLPGQVPPRTWTRVDRADLPAVLRDRLEHRRFYLHRLEGAACTGVVLVPDDVHPAALAAVADVLRPAAVALANVERFERLRDLADSSARRRLAHDLHDGVAQALTHVRFELELLGLEHEQLHDDVDRIRGVADAALLEVRRTVGELRESAPLSDRVERHVDLLSSFAPAAIELELQPELDVPDVVADDLFRITQEALSNAVRHARATTIRVSVMSDDDSVAVLVADDGVGIPEPPTPGVGLSGMQSRAQRLGGELTIRRRRGGGTVVELDAPLGPPAPPAPSPPDLSSPIRSTG